MRKLALILSFLMLLPLQALGDDDTITKIEAKIGNAKGFIGDFEGALEVLESSPIRDDRELYNALSNEINRVKDYFERNNVFYKLAVVKGEEANAIANYQSLIQAYNDMPKEYHFSDKFSRGIATGVEWSMDWAEQFVKKECGEDYLNIRVGMKLSKVQKCVGEFYLRGQMNTKAGVVDHYTRGDSYLYVKKGRVVAWGG